ncbi:hypothetical protein HZ993_09300 [Rhodoferax sp. AJA081-3]|uniref:hypothetical protein n=1 Tax=Rhodoferax sp. AJA081-3 TaxID=2752316 RepID=UPI001AE0CEE9|nr:hypothetical protein [Rhodoferax sp. AJA081-3]QTN29976.1 hypothetical protein HZ993_09300 [Rhodoferax sp. AJA081-3]
MSENISEVASEVDPIEPIFQGQCLSLSERSTLTFAIGRHVKDATLHIRLLKNSGGGRFFDGWAAGTVIQDVVLGETGLTAKSFHIVQPQRSVNNSCFLMAVIKDLGLIRANEQNSRVHDHVPGTTMEQLVSALLSESKNAESKAARRKAKET